MTVLVVIKKGFLVSFYHKVTRVCVCVSVHRLKELSESLEKQHNLLKLIVQKMEINSEAEEHDGPPVLHNLTHKLRAKSKWGPLLRAVTAKRK